jgi:DNA-binding MarR family transcriptional regulator
MVKPLARRSTSVPSPGQVADAVLEITLLVTTVVAPNVRRLHPLQLSLSQLRALGFLDANPDAALSPVADYVGVALPSASALVDDLARRGLVARRNATDDRRRLRLRLTPAGMAALRTGRAAARAALRARFDALSPRERVLIARTMARLRPFLAARV